MLSHIRRIVRLAYGDEPPTVEQWSMRHANKTTPDGIIAEAIILSIAKDFEDWESDGELSETQSRPESADRKFVFATKAEAETYDRASGRNPSNLVWRSCGGVLLRNQKKNIVLQVGWIRASRDRDNALPWYYVGDDKVNGIVFPKHEAMRIIRRYNELKAARQKAAEGAAKAKADMERNELAWNLAERLLNMRRSAYGALEPIPIEERLPEPKGSKKLGSTVQVEA